MQEYSDNHSLKNESNVSSAMSSDEHPAVAIIVCSPQRLK